MILSHKKKFLLMKEIYDLVRENTTGLSKGHIGEDLAYLLGAIMRDSCIETAPSTPLNLLLKIKLPGDHIIWQYIVIDKAADFPDPWKDQQRPFEQKSQVGREW